MGRSKPKRVSDKTKELLRSLPSVSSLLENDEVSGWMRELPRSTVVTSLQAALGHAREAIITGELNGDHTIEDILSHAEGELIQRSMPSLRRVINATGIILHTGLGRAPLSAAAVEAIAEGAAGYCNLEYDLESGKRGKRQVHVVDLLISITGAESATVVNNNAAATLLILQTFASAREVVVSRGQLIEIGGSFRIPDIMRAGGAILHEVGTTNRTRISDFEGAINDNTAILLRAHPSNFRVVGFTEEVGMAALSSLAHERDLLAVDDLGSGALVDPSDLGLPNEPFVRESLSAGADLVCFSGDKLLGGPQCGLIVGKRELIDRINANPLMRTYRVGKLTLLALEATLRSHQDPATARQDIPTLAALAGPTEALADRAKKLADLLVSQVPNDPFLVCSDIAFAGGGSMPDREIQSVVVQWRPVRASVTAMSIALRDADVPVIARIRDDAICFDLRTVRDDDFEALVDAVSTAVWDAENGDSSNDGKSLRIL